MEAAVDKISTLDLEYQQQGGVISAFLAPTGDGNFVLLESGPASTLDALERGVEAAGFGLDRLVAVLLTHVHLDHAAAAGTLARRTGCEVWVHPDGAHHMVDPDDKLLPSAERLYGEMLVPLFGVMEGVPADRLRLVEHGTTVRFGDLEAVGWFTPGHARHHVAWQVGPDVATGDLAGVRLPGSDHVLPPMPPPDIDVEAWLRSLALVRGLGPQRLLLTHFGAWEDPEPHLDQLEQRLDGWTLVAEEVLNQGADGAELARRLKVLDDEGMDAAGVSENLRLLYRLLCPVKENSAGLFRYVAKKAGGSAQ